MSINISILQKYSSNFRTGYKRENRNSISILQKYSSNLVTTVVLQFKPNLFQYYKSTLQTQTFAATLLRMTPISILQKYSSNIIKKTIFSVIFSEFQYYKSTLQTSAAAEEDKPQGSVISILQKYSSNLTAARDGRDDDSLHFNTTKVLFKHMRHGKERGHDGIISILQKYSSNFIFSSPPLF